MAELPYEEQLIRKQEYLDKLLGNFAEVKGIIYDDEPYHYRNKIQVTFGLDEKHHVIMGNYLAGSHFVVEIDECLICDQTALEILKALKKLVIRYHITVFDEDRSKGCIRHAMVRCNHNNEYMLIIVTGSPVLKNQKELISSLRKEFPQIKTIIQNINRARTSMILGENEKILYGDGHLIDSLCGKRFRVSASSFYQVNKVMTEVLYQQVIAAACFQGDETIIDAYCGTGTIGLLLADQVKELIGVELNKRAVNDAIKNMKINDIENASFICDDAGHYMSELAKMGTQIDAVIMDPPRSGADIKFLRSLVSLKPKKIIYVSCGPESLKANLSYFKKHSYKINSIQPVEMFPFTQHVETVVLMSRDKE